MGSLARRLALLEAARRTGAIIIEDDYDSEFRYEGRPVESLQGLDRTDCVVYAGSFSKSVLPSLRVGFLVLPPQILTPFIAAKAVWDSGTHLLEQAALARFMASGELERHIRRMRRLYRSRRDAMVDALVESFGGKVVVGERHGGLNVLVSLDTDMSDEAVVAAASAADIGLRSARDYFLSPPERPAFLMGFSGKPEDAIREGVRQLASVLRP